MRGFAGIRQGMSGQVHPPTSLHIQENACLFLFSCILSDMENEAHHRIRRLRRLEGLLPLSGTAPGVCPDQNELIRLVADASGPDSEAARPEILQQDLDELVRQGRIETASPDDEPPRYRRLGDEPDDDPLVWQYTLRQVSEWATGLLPPRRAERFSRRMMKEVEGPLLDGQRLRIVPDMLQLRPVEVGPEVLRAVVVALAERRVLRILYEKAHGGHDEVQIHPHAIVQRGPIGYLFALKNDEEAPMRLYTMHRIVRANVLTAPARIAPGFNLDRYMAHGRVDFGQGAMIDMEIRVRGDLESLLRICPISDHQTIQDEPPDSAFSARLQARLQLTSHLIHWLLGHGDMLEVLAPPELRRMVKVQATKMTGIYRDSPIIA